MESSRNHSVRLTQDGSDGPTGLRDRDLQPKAGGRWWAGFRSAVWVALLAGMFTLASVHAADFVIVVDASGSMKDSVGPHDKRIRITLVQDALRQYLPALPSESRVYLIAFNSGIVAEKEVVLRNEKSLGEALAWVDDLPGKAHKRAQTYLWTTLRHALKIASRYSLEYPDQPVTVRVLTDGMDNEKVTTLDNVLREFLPFLDGEKIQSNLVLLGDLELQTKLSLPEGAFETTKNPTWEVLFPPIVLWVPAEPRIGDDVRFFENTTKSIYRDYEWQVDGTTVGKEKVLTWRFDQPRTYRVTLKATGLQGTRNSATVVVKAREREKLAVDFVPSNTQPEPMEEVKFMGRCSGHGVTYAWFVNSTQVATTQDLSYRFGKENTYEVKLVACDETGSSSASTQVVEVKERELTVSIKGPAEVISGHTAQFISEVTGAYASLAWDFGDGTPRTERNPEHTFEGGDSEFKDYVVGLRATSPLGKVVEATPHMIRVWAVKQIPIPQARFRLLTQNPKVGDPIQTIEEATGLVETVQWDVDGEPKGSARNPEFRFSTPGEKTIRMTVRGPGGESIATQKVTVLPQYTQPVVWCGVSKSRGKVPLTVQFTSRITGDYKSLLWTFGDGQSSTDCNPRHTFTKVANHVVSLTLTPMDAMQPVVSKQLTIKVIKPWPMWAKVLFVVGPCWHLFAWMVWTIRQSRRKALRLPVYYFAEQAPMCKTAVLTESGQILPLTPAASLRLRREGKSRNLVVEPLDGAALLNTDGQEMTAIPVGDGVRVTVRDASGQTRAVAISIRQKPCRPTSVASDQELIPEDGVCGLLTPAGHAPEPVPSDDFEWGWDKATNNAV